MNQIDKFTNNIVEILLFLEPYPMKSSSFNDTPTQNNLLNNSQTNFYKFNDIDLEILRLIARILCSFSIAGILFVILLFIFVRSVRSFVLELAVWLCFTNLFFNINVYFPVNFEKPNSWCYSQALISTFSDLSSMIWTTLFGIFSYFSVVKSGFIDKNKKNLRLLFIMIAYLIPGIFTLM